jgi:hypothetical protein
VHAPTPAPGPMPAGCYVDNSQGPVSFKYAAGNLFPGEKNHGVKLVDTAAQSWSTRLRSAVRCARLTRTAPSGPTALVGRKRSLLATMIKAPAAF